MNRWLGNEIKQSPFYAKLRLFVISFLLIPLLIAQHFYASDLSLNELKKGNPSPKIEFNTTSLDIGLVKPGDKAQGVFIIKNTGNADLVIKRVAPT